MKHENKFTCGDCGKSLSTNPTQNEIAEHLEEHEIFEFHCIHCKEPKLGTNDVATMQMHMVDHHPSQFSFVAARRIKQRIAGWTLAIVHLWHRTEHIHLYDICEFADSFDLNRMDPVLWAKGENESMAPNADCCRKINFSSERLCIIESEIPKQIDAMMYNVYVKQRVDRNSMSIGGEEDEPDVDETKCWRKI